MRPINLLAVSGAFIERDDGTDFWQLVAAAEKASGALGTHRAWHEVEDNDLLLKDAILCYSWGCASVFKAIERLRKAGKLRRIPVLIIMAGVPRGLGQLISVKFGGGWVVPDEVDEAICLQVDSFPVSYPIKNSGPNRVNILITGIPGNDHVGIENYKDAHDIVVNVLSMVATAVGETFSN